MALSPLLPGCELHSVDSVSPIRLVSSDCLDGTVIVDIEY